MRNRTKQKIKREFPNILSWTFLVLIAAIFLLLGYLLFVDGNPPITLNNEPLPISVEIASPGDEVYMVNDFCKHTEARSELHAFWQRKEDGLIWAQTRNELSVSNEGCQVLTIPLVIPPDIPPGEWKRVNIATYQVNVLGKHTADWESEYITIVEK